MRSSLFAGTVTVTLATALVAAMPAAQAQTTGTAGATTAAPATGGDAAVQRATGTVKQVEARKLTLDDGTSYELAEGVTVQNIRPGERVEVTYGMERGQRVATDVGVVGAAAAGSTGSSSPPKKPDEAGQANTTGAGGAGAAPKR